MIDFDPYNEKFMQGDRTIFKKLREEEPAFYSKKYKCWFFSRYDDVKAISKDYEHFSVENGVTTSQLLLGEPTGAETFALMDLPRHKSHRGLINHNIQQSVKKIIELSNKEMYELFGSESTHQGIVLTTSRLTQPNLDDILYESINKKTEVVIMLDQVTDPNNIGSIMRSCILFNCKSHIPLNTIYRPRPNN